MAPSLFCHAPTTAVTVIAECGTLECGASAKAGSRCGFAGLGWTCVAQAPASNCTPAVVQVVVAVVDVPSPSPSKMTSPSPVSLSLYPSLYPSAPSQQQDSLANTLKQPAVIAVISIAAVAILAIVGLLNYTSRQRTSSHSKSLNKDDINCPPPPPLFDILPTPADPNHFLNRPPSMRSLPDPNRIPAFYYKDDFYDLDLLSLDSIESKRSFSTAHTQHRFMLDRAAQQLHDPTTATTNTSPIRLRPPTDSLDLVVNMPRALARRVKLERSRDVLMDPSALILMDSGGARARARLGNHHEDGGLDDVVVVMERQVAIKENEREIKELHLLIMRHQGRLMGGVVEQYKKEWCDYVNAEEFEEQRGESP
ncbi:hypothetical protein HDU79_005361 [Rhizoclosmatium sp. JEL0117]|nr:hypothetical protein HDU79_005361 [Rhizoclosmatium sp. JEL0117]